MKKYQIIYADPPWEYKKTGGTTSSRGMAKQFYKTMELADICLLPIHKIVATDCVLFLWATFPRIKEALAVLESWGFKYHNVAFVWIKKTKLWKDFVGMGYWTRANPEICLLGVRGNPKPKSHAVRQLIYSQRMKHSQKPPVVRDKIVELCGDISRVELFARAKPKGWDVWGNEVESDIEL